MKRKYRSQEGYRIDYTDTGCKFAPSCLNCPFLECKEVLADNAKLKSRRREIPLRESPAEIAEELNVYVGIRRLNGERPAHQPHRS